jgi:hypothetical protein
MGQSETGETKKREIRGQKTDERGGKIGLNEFAGGERLNDLNNLNNGPLTTDHGHPAPLGNLNCSYILLVPQGLFFRA